MVTQAQVESNRKNSQLSTWPRTEEGKNTTRFNAFKHGEYSTIALTAYQRLYLAHFALKISFGIIPCTPLVPSTTWVMRKFTATLASMYASSWLSFFWV